MSRLSLILQLLIRKSSSLLWRFYFGIVYRPSFIYFGKKARIARPMKIEGAQNISIGSGSIINTNAWLGALPLMEGVEPRLVIGAVTYIGRNAHIIAIKHVNIGDKVLIADRVYISDNLHEYYNPNIPVMDQPVVIKGEVEIGNGSWIGENVCIIGTRIGKNCVIGANSVVTSEIPDYCVAIGAPARIIKRWNKEKHEWLNEEV